MSNVIINNSGAPTRNQLTESALHNLQDKTKIIAKYNEQADSGQKYQSFLDLNNDGLLSSYNNLSKQISQNQVHTQGNLIIRTQMNEAYMMLTGLMEDVIASQSLLAASVSPSGKAINFSTIMTGKLEELQRTLNASPNGKAIFGGYDSNDKAISDIVNVSNLDDNGVPTANYAIKSQEKISYFINGTQEIKYNVVAGDPAFVNIIGAYHLAKQGDDPSKIKEAQEYLATGMQQLQLVIDQLGNNISQINRAQESLNMEKLSLYEKNGDFFMANPAETAIVVNSAMGAIQSSQWMIKQLFRYSLLDMLGNM